MMSVTGDRAAPRSSAASRSPTSPPGCSVPSAILCALVARERTGRGQHVDTSLFEGALALAVWETTELWVTGRVPAAARLGEPLTAPYQALRTRDGYINVGGDNERLWRAAVRGARTRRSCPTTRASHQRRSDGEPGRAGRRAGADAGRARHGRLGRAALAAASRAGRSETTRQVFADPHTRRGRWSWRWSTRSREHSRPWHPGEAQPHPRRGAERGSAARPAHGGDPARRGLRRQRRSRR